MRRAPLLLGAGILFWGWQCGFFEFAIGMALALEGILPLKTRWDLTDRDFERISDLSAVLLAGLTLYQFDDHGFHAIFPILESTPFVFFPLVLAQRLSTREGVSYAALLLSIRRGLRRGRIKRVGVVDVAYPFFMVCALAASAGHLYEEGFFVGLAVLAAWLLFCHRPQGRSIFPWVGGLVVAFGIAYLSQLGMIEARRGLEPLLIQLFQERLWSRRDPYRSQTAIGQIGRLKVSQRIVARVRPLDGGSVPPRLREAAYRTYSRQMWLAPGTKFTDVAPLGGGSVWEFDRQGAPRYRDVRLSSSLHYGRGVLMVPNGTYRIQGLNVDRLSRNELGAIKVSTGPDLIEFSARFASDERYVEPPGPIDLSVPEKELELFAGIAAELELEGRSRREVLSKVRAYFADGFSYSLVRRRRFGIFVRPLKEFLINSRSGHCEYFATATVLLLRAAGIPARYISGYAINEWSPLEQAFIVRRRHAHSWASAFVDGAWRDVDTTPGVWVQSESNDSPWWVDGYDVLAWLRYKFNQWRYEDSDWVDAQTLIALALGLVTVLGWRLARRTGLVRPEKPITVPRDWPGTDSEVYEVEQTLGRWLGPRREGETWQAWLARCEAARGPLPGGSLLHEEILPLHYRYRFDPDGLNPSERVALRLAVNTWLAAHGRDGMGKSTP